MNKKIHILLLPSWYPSDANDIYGSFFREQALALSKSGHRVGVIAPIFRTLKDITGLFNKPYGYRVNNDEGVKTYRWYGVNYTPKLIKVVKKIRLCVGEKLFNKYIKENGLPEILHVHSLNDAGFLALKISKKYNIPYIITEHSSLFARGLIKKEVTESLNDVVQNSSYNIAVSNEFTKLLNSTFNSKSWNYLPNMVNSFFLNEELVIKEDTEYFEFINVCFQNENKRVDLLIKSFSKAFKGNRNVRLKLVGDGPSKYILEELVKIEGISKQVTFLGELDREKVKREISSADAFVLSSNYETFGVVIIEALALGKPVIATCCGGPESIVTPDVGYLVPKNSIGELSKAMLELYKNKEKFNAFNIRKYCEENFSELAVTKKLQPIYLQAIQRKITNER
ncbi:glycosyltransferase [Pseudoalteromonas sp. APC 3691]|uniref:glycosyltransferase n=1 Tax=Pseudoalteromonas sp. APC 3691 TaxID=3035173 RepID=UPI0025B485B8|nr:glycosyltransferase [Pseudoalteromonas sp. APC 3691]MDN3389540.1 glycosyltransferase [Pseudoalteromonas sp. APC 3691]